MLGTAPVASRRLSCPHRVHHHRRRPQPQCHTLTPHLGVPDRVSQRPRRRFQLDSGSPRVFHRQLITPGRQHPHRLAPEHPFPPPSTTLQLYRELLKPTNQSTSPLWHLRRRHSHRPGSRPPQTTQLPLPAALDIFRPRRLECPTAPGHVQPPRPTGSRSPIKALRPRIYRQQILKTRSLALFADLHNMPNPLHH